PQSRVISCHSSLRKTLFSLSHCEASASSFPAMLKSRTDEHRTPMEDTRRSSETDSLLTSIGSLIEPTRQSRLPHSALLSTESSQASRLICTKDSPPTSISLPTRKVLRKRLRWQKQ